MSAARCPFEDDVLLLADAAAAGADALPPTRRMIVEAHLAVCSSCAATEDALDRAAAAVRGTVVPALGTADAALARIAAERVPVPGAFPRRAVAAAVLVAGAAAAAAALLRTGPDATAPDRSTPVDVSGGGTPRTTSPTEPAATTPVPAPAVVPPMPEGPAAPFRPRSLDDLDTQIDALDPAARADDPALAAAVRRVSAAGMAGAGALAERIDVRTPDRAARAALVAGHVRSSQCVAPLGAVLRDDRGCDGPLAAATAGALAAIATPAAVDELVAALDGPSRDAALDALAGCRSSRVFGALADRLRDGRDSAPAELLDTVVALAPRDAARLVLDLAADRALAPAAATALRVHAAVLTPHLIALASRGDGLVTAAAVRALGETRSPAAVATLRAAASRPGLARAAADALVAIGTDDSCAAAFDVVADPRAPRELVQAFDGAAAAVRVLAAAVGDARLARRIAAVDALGRTGAESAVEPLARAAREPSLRRPAIEALGRIRGDASAAALAPWARTKSSDPALVAALGATRSPVAVTPLRALAREPALTASAAAALAGIDDAESVLALAELLAEPRAARAAADALASMPAGVVVPALLGRLDDAGDAAAASRARRALVLVAGADLGRAPEAWHTWWDARRPRSQEEPR